MIDDRDLGQLVASVFDAAAPARSPERLLDAVATSVSQTRQRTRWLALLKERPMRYASHVAVGSPTLRLAVIVAITVALITALAGAVIAGSSQLPSPTPVQPSPTAGVPGNGLIAYGAQAGITTLDTATGDTNLIVPGDAFSPTWSPNGRSLAYYEVTDCCKGGGSFQGMLHIVGADGSGNVQVMSRPPLRWQSYLQRLVSWAPDSQSLAYPDGTIHVFDLVHGTTTDTGIVADSAAWSPDGHWLAYGPSNVSSTSQGVWLAAPDGTGKHPLTDDKLGADLGWLSWSPDSSTLAFTCCSDPDSEDLTSAVRTVTIDGTAHALTGEDAWDSGPDWSPDGTRLAFVQAGAIVVMDKTGSTPRWVYEIPSPNPAKARINWSPDARMLLVVVDWNLFAIVPLDGSPSTTYPMNLGSASWQAIWP